MDPFLGMSIVRDSRLGRAETGGRAWCFVVLRATGGPVVLNRGFKYIVARPKIQENIEHSSVGRRFGCGNCCVYVLVRLSVVCAL